MNNYQKHIEQIKNLHHKPTLLLHVCCGVCSVYPLVYLSKYFKITIYFSNSNITPYEEFVKRLDALNTYLNIIKEKDIKLVVDDYDYESYRKALINYKDQKEGQERCYICYQMRMQKSFEYATKNQFEYVTTIMSISNRKNADYINAIGEALNKEYPSIQYLYADFKKGDGITLNDKMNKDLGLYHQNYCGCEFSNHQEECRR